MTAASDPADETLAADRPVRVLHVEDDPDLARLVAQVLSASPEARFELTHRTDLASALGVLEAREVDLLLLDLEVEDGDASSTIADACGLARHIPIVVLSSCDDDEVAAHAHRAGVAAYLVKQRQDRAGLAAALLRALEAGPPLVRDARRWLGEAG